VTAQILFFVNLLPLVATFGNLTAMIAPYSLDIAQHWDINF